MHVRHAVTAVGIAATVALGLTSCGPGSDDQLTVSTQSSQAPWPWETSPPTPTAGRSATVTPSATPTPTQTVTSSSPTQTQKTAPRSKSPKPKHEPKPPATKTAAPQPPPPPRSTPPAGGSLTQREAEVVALTNEERADNGCDTPLRVDNRLVAAAKGHSADMASRNFFSHTNPDGDGPGERAAAQGYPQWSGENIAMGFPTAAAVVKAWMKSKGHRANILNCDSVAIGVGAADSSRGIYWTQVFGSV